MLELTVTAVASDGRGVARDGDGKVVFVAGALPGEQVKAEIVSHRTHFTSAVVTDVSVPSPDRVAPPCPHVAEGCGGCQWQHVAPAAQRRLKADLISSTIKRLARFDPPPLRPTEVLEPWGFRTSVRLAVGPAASARAGFRAPRSHDVVAADGCLITHPLLLDLVERPWPGAREVTLRAGTRTGERLAQVTPARAGRNLPAGVRRRDFHEEAAGRRWRISAGSFFQSRPDGADALARLVVEAAAGRAAGGTAGAGRAVDLYSGVGLFAGALAGEGWTVTAVEGSPVAAADAAANLSGAGVEVVRADVGRWDPTGHRSADVVVADPSRAGLGRSGVATVTGLRPERVVLISCDVAAMARDLGLLRRGGYSVTSITPVDMFPHSFHVEVVSVLDRGSE